MVFTIAILAISLSIDAFGVGVVYGLRKISIPLVPKLLICFFSIIYSGISLTVGKSLSNVLSPNISKFIGVTILALMGLWIIVQALLKKEGGSPPVSSKTDEIKTLLKIVIKSLGITIQVVRNPAEGDVDRSGSIDMREALILGLALSVDAIGVGVGSALAGFHSMLIPFAVGLFQLIFLYAGTFLGKKFVYMARLNKKVLSLLPGLLLISLAVIRIY